MRSWYSASPGGGRFAPPRQAREAPPSDRSDAVGVYPPSAFETIDQHRDRPRGERKAITELALCQRAVRLEVLERVEVGATDARRACQGRAHAVAFQTEALKAGGKFVSSETAMVFSIQPGLGTIA